MNRRSKTILVSGVILLIATIIVSLICIDDWSGVTGWAFVTMLWSEVVLFGGLVFVPFLLDLAILSLIARSAQM